MPFSAYVSVLLLGILGGVHCAGMCGGFVAAATSSAPARIHLGRAAIHFHMLPYHVGRIASYMLAGIVFGAFGAAIGGLSAWLSVQGVMFALSNALLIALGVALALHGSGLSRLERAGARAFGLLAPITRRLAPANGWPQRLALGMVWGFVPCGMVYAVLALALLAGDPWTGAGLGLVFGLGTLPNLLAAGWLLHRLRGLSSRYWLRALGGLALVGFGAVGLLRSEGLASHLALLCGFPP